MAKVQVIKFAAFYNEGNRGMSGGSAKNDKVWGIAKVGNTLVNFWGRRNKTLQFKTHLASGESKIMAKYEEKIGKRTSGDVYTVISPMSAVAKSIAPNLEKDLSHYYYSAMATGKLNTSH